MSRAIVIYPLKRPRFVDTLQAGGSMKKALLIIDLQNDYFPGGKSSSSSQGTLPEVFLLL